MSDAPMESPATDPGPEPQGSAVGQPAGGQGDLSAEIGRGERATADPEQDTGEGSAKPYYTT